MVEDGSHAAAACNGAHQHHSSADEEALSELTAQLSQFNWKEGVVDRAKRLLYSSDVQENVKGVLNLKAMLCIGREEVYEVAQEVIDSGVINRLVEFLKVDNRELQWPAAFCLTNIAAGHDAQTQIVVEAGAIPPLIAFLRDRDPQLRRQAIFCLANVAGSTQEYRIMLARKPDYFPAMFCAGDMASDAKVLELVCWNLRNVCLLGGPSFDEIRPAVDYLLNRILKRYLHFQYWSGCVRYALETISAVCRTPEGREAMLRQDLTQTLLSLIERVPSSSLSITQSAFEALAWIIAFGPEHERRVLVRNHTVIDVIVNHAIQGRYAAVVQELALKCLTCIAGDNDKELLLCILESHEQIIDVTAQIFMGLLSVAASGAAASSAAVLTLPASGVRECAAFVFIQCLLLSRYIPTLHMKVLVSQEVVKVVIEAIEFASEQIRARQLLGPNAAEVLRAANSPPGTSPTTASPGPTLPAVSESLAIAGLKALGEHISEGEAVQNTEELLQNPVMMMCVENDIPNRLRNVLNSTALPEEGYQLGGKLLQRCIREAPAKSSLFGYS